MENKFRPNSFKSFVGQEKLKKMLSVIIRSSKKQEIILDHILLHGKPGLGKTTLARLIAKKAKVNIQFIQGPQLEKKADIISLLSSLNEGDIVFIDEIHGINTMIEELFYSAMEDWCFDIQIGPEGDSKFVRVSLPKFTIIGATTKLELVTKPLVDRFGIVSQLSNYNKDEIAEIVRNSSERNGWELIEESDQIISSASQLNPRVANNLLKRCNDYAIVNNEGVINRRITKHTLRDLGIYKYGLNDSHISYMKCIWDVFKTRAASLDAISGIIGKSKLAIKRDIEPLLLSTNLIFKTSSGRKLSDNGLEYIDKNMKLFV